jgi:hypothetical protein
MPDLSSIILLSTLSELKRRQKAAEKAAEKASHTQAAAASEASRLDSDDSFQVVYRYISGMK